MSNPPPMPSTLLSGSGVVDANAAAGRFVSCMHDVISAVSINIRRLERT
jgi:hypothetical protein